MQYKVIRNSCSLRLCFFLLHQQVYGRVITVGWAGGLGRETAMNEPTYTLARITKGSGYNRPFTVVYSRQIPWPHSDLKIFEVKVALDHSHRKRHFRADAATPGIIAWLLASIGTICI